MLITFLTKKFEEDDEKKEQNEEKSERVTLRRLVEDNDNECLFWRQHSWLRSIVWLSISIHIRFFEQQLGNLKSDSNINDIALISFYLAKNRKKRQKKNEICTTLCSINSNFHSMEMIFVLLERKSNIHYFDFGQINIWDLCLISHHLTASTTTL